MSHPGRMITVSVDGNQSFQVIDGFGVNINSRYYEPRLLPALDLLYHDLGARLYRVDIWGKSNWIDPTGKVGPSSLDPAGQAAIYRDEIFQRGWGMVRWLNEHGVKPYLTASGIVPGWMLGPDGKTLADFEAFTTMLADMLDWAKNREKLDFNLFGPLNETDIGAPEGPTVGPEEIARVCDLLVEKLDARGLSDIRLVVAEQAHFHPRYIQALAASEELRGRIGAFGMHTYTDLPPEQYREVVEAVQNASHAGIPLWMTEYGDLEQSGEREWYVAWVMTSRLFDLLEAGFRGALVWDAYDNYHDHDEFWTIYGLLRTGLRVFTPKKRYYASKQVFRYVRPGYARIAAGSSSPDLRVLAFASPERDALTVVGINQGSLAARLNVQLSGLDENIRQVTYFRTSETENCHGIEQIPVKGPNWPFTGIDVLVPPASIFTLVS